MNAIDTLSQEDVFYSDLTEACWDILPEHFHEKIRQNLARNNPKANLKKADLPYFLPVLREHIKTKYPKQN